MNRQKYGITSHFKGFVWLLCASPNKPMNFVLDGNKNNKRMRVKTFDKLFGVALSFAFGFSYGVAVAS
jgi:hypothetical protein